MAERQRHGREKQQGRKDGGIDRTPRYLSSGKMRTRERVRDRETKRDLGRREKA